MKKNNTFLHDDDAEVWLKQLGNMNEECFHFFHKNKNKIIYVLKKGMFYIFKLKVDTDKMKIYYIYTKHDIRDDRGVILLK